MEQRFIVNKFKCIASAVSSVTFVLLAGAVLFIHRPGSALIFLVLGLIFGFIAVQSGSVLQLNEEGVTRLLLGHTTAKIRWDEIKEIGVAGTKVFNRSHPEKAGSIYIYFSPVQMDEDERFQMMLRWPPSNCLYMTYNQDRFHAVQGHWNSHIEIYNVGDLCL